MVVEPAGELALAPQEAQLAEALLLLNLPGSHWEHVEAEAFENSPTAQSRHSDFPGIAENLPGRQSLHVSLISPETAKTLPAWHKVQFNMRFVAPIAGPQDPALHAHDSFVLEPAGESAWVPQERQLSS